jgi:hypothetical protein
VEEHTQTAWDGRRVCAGLAANLLKNHSRQADASSFVLFYRELLKINKLVVEAAGVERFFHRVSC